MNAIISLIYTALDIYKWMIIIQVIMGWLVAYNIINSQSPFVYSVGNFLHKVTEPALAKIRRYLPDFGGIDVSAIIAVIAIVFLQRLLIMDIAPALL